MQERGLNITKLFYNLIEYRDYATNYFIYYINCNYVVDWGGFNGSWQGV